MANLLHTFTGCKVGEERLGLLVTKRPDKRTAEALKRVSSGVLAITRDDGKYRWFALTPKGKKLLARREAHFANMI